MKSATLPSFWATYEILNADVKRSARKAYRLWMESPFHPSLRFKCVNREENVWSVRITRGYRALGILEGDTVTWFWIGSHDEYERFIITRMGFDQRVKSATQFIRTLYEAYWNKDEIKNNIHHIPYGYEQCITQKEYRDLLKNIETTTSNFIRFMPDFILLSKKRVMLLDYKVTRTPRYSLKERQWDIGQIEADAWNNYINLQNIGIDTAIIIYCPYHHRPLIADILNGNWVVGSRTQVKQSTGSGTDYINIDLKQISSFEDFMSSNFGVDKSTTQKLLSVDFFNNLKNDTSLTIKHHDNSPYKENQTGFNWDNRYTGVQ